MNPRRPLIADGIERIAAQIRINRRKKRAALAQMFRALSDRYTEDALDKLSQRAVDDPGVVWSLLRRQPKDLADLVETTPGLKDLVEITLALMLSRRKQRRWKPSQKEIADFAHHVAEGNGISLYAAYKRVGKMLGMSEAAVKQAEGRKRKNNP
jgi:hypothetical protein